MVIQNKLDNMATTESTGKEKCLADSPVVQPMDSFRVLNESEVQKLIEATPKKSCTLDPMPTPLVVGCIDILLPVITKVINLSLQTGSFADQWKCALVHPLLKKLGLDLVFQSFRPVSNLQYISKLAVKAVFSQTHEHMVVNEICPDLQSSYRQHHSTETALLKVMNDVLLKMNSQHVTLMVLLDLSASFNTVDPNIFLERLHRFGHR